MFVMNTLISGGLIVLFSSLLAAGVVLIIRQFVTQRVLIQNHDFVNTTYPIVGLIYGVFLAFTIVITWGEFNRAETSTTNEVAHLSELWRDAEVFPQTLCEKIHNQLFNYANQVVNYEWDIMAKYGKVSVESEASYSLIWRLYYSYEPSTERQKTFYTESISQLNKLGSARRHRVLFASAKVQPMVRLFLVVGGFFIVGFSFLLACPSMQIQIIITMLIASLTAFSIFLVLALQRPFSGDVNVKSTAFTNIIESFEKRRADEFSCSSLKSL